MELNILIKYICIGLKNRLKMLLEEIKKEKLKMRIRKKQKNSRRKTRN